MLTRSCKNKGRRLQNEVRDKILENFQNLKEEDVKVAIMGEQGVDIHLSPFAANIFPFSVECKNQEKLNIWKSLEQSETNCKGNTNSLLVFKRNRSKVYVCLDLEVFLNILKNKKIDLDI